MSDSTSGEDADWRVQYGKLVAKAWSDDAFKAKLLSDPVAAFAEAGVPIPAGKTVKVVENTEVNLYLVLPPAPEEELTEEALEQVAGGLTCSCLGTYS